MSQSSRLGWAYLKEGFAGYWTPSWLSLMNRTLSYTTENENWEAIDLKKTKDITIRKDIKNLDAPKTSEFVPVLVIDFVDRSLYILVNNEREADTWRSNIEKMAFNNGNTLIDQQMTGDDIPVIVDKCIKFVFSQGCMTEGIYRHSGVKTKIDKLLKDFRFNAWSVQISRDQFSEHDVANTLKRFFRTLDEPLLTEMSRSRWMDASCIKDDEQKLKQYKFLLNKLPRVNYNTLRRLISHLYAVAAQCDKNLMPNYNLSAIWGPTLLTVDGQEANDFARTSAESDVCKDLIDNYPTLFNVNAEELDREKKITEVLEKISNHSERGQHGHLKRSGDLRLWVYIDTKTSGHCVCLDVHPTMTAIEMTQKVLIKINRENSPDKDLYLHEMIMGGTLERPLHHSELILDVTLKWGSWDDYYRNENYLLLKRNLLYEEALPMAKPPLSVFGEAHFGDNKPKSKFSKHLFSINNANVTCYREQKSGIPFEFGSWPIEDINWYIGSEIRRKAPHSQNITFIEKEVPVNKSKERPFFGKTISFESHDLFIKWIAAMLVAEHSNDVKHKKLIET